MTCRPGANRGVLFQFDTVDCTHENCSRTQMTAAYYYFSQTHADDRTTWFYSCTRVFEREIICSIAGSVSRQLLFEWLEQFSHDRVDNNEPRAVRVAIASGRDTRVIQPPREMYCVRTRSRTDLTCSLLCKANARFAR